MKIVVAPDKFKGSLAAGQVAAAIAAGLRAELFTLGLPAAELVTIPVADGGEFVGKRGAGRFLKCDLSPFARPLGRHVTSFDPVTGSTVSKQV